MSSLDRLQAPHALALEHGCGRARDQHALHDRLEPQVELDRRPLGDTEDFDAQICRSRDRERHLPLGPRAAAELASIEHERRSRVQAGHVITSGVRTQQIRGIVSAACRAGQNESARGSAGLGARPAGRSEPLARRSSGTRPDTSPPKVATSLTRLEDTKRARGWRARTRSRRR